MAEPFLLLGWNFPPAYGRPLARRNTKQAQTTKPLEAKIWFWLRNHEHWAGDWSRFCPKPMLKHFSAITTARNLDFLAIKRKWSTRPLYRLLNATLETTQLLSGLSLLSSSQLKAPRDTKNHSPWVCSSHLSPSLLKICSVCLICICLPSYLSRGLLFRLSLTD